MVGDGGVCSVCVMVWELRVVMVFSAKEWGWDMGDGLKWLFRGWGGVL